MIGKCNIEEGDWVEFDIVPGKPYRGIVTQIGIDMLQIDSKYWIKSGLMLVGKQLSLPTNSHPDRSAQGDKKKSLPAGIPGDAWLEHKKVNGQVYLQYRWRDPETGKKRSRYLGRADGSGLGAARSCGSSPAKPSKPG
ncbi:MAG: hypothetical protein KME35_08045 [Aphanocapsa sp. GSE-SYN-MK-11-07L]|jgi:hypothetical protein|nr:hypothetical protein [Aphanocapsa sp. GSE-SYN-MK-11-07L]